MVLLIFFDCNFVRLLVVVVDKEFFKFGKEGSDFEFLKEFFFLIDFLGSFK